MIARICALFLLLPVLSLDPIPSARAEDYPSIRYVLGSDSQMVEGCFDPCMCPIWIRGDLEGSFILEPAGLEENFMTFEVQGVDLRVQGTPKFRATGTGRYRFSIGGVRLQELTLDLEVDDGVVERFSSGLVPAEVTFPEILVSVAKNNFYCYDQALTLVASPHDRRATWGSIKSLYTE